MQELHVVAVSEDGRHVVLATHDGATARAEFQVAMDGRLKAAIRGDLPRFGEHEAPRSAVTPKEIQSRLRAGESVEQIAAAAGVPAARVERFAGPVLSERERMVAGARAAVLARPRRGLSALPLGDAVAEHLQDMAGHEADSTTWSARREESGRWLVQVSFLARGKQRTAGWRYDAATRQVVAVDAWSAAIAHADVPAARRARADGTRPRRQPSAQVVPGGSITAAPPVLLEPPAPPRRPAPARADAPVRGTRRAAAPSPAGPDAAAGPPAAQLRVTARTAAPPEADDPAAAAPAEGLPAAGSTPVPAADAAAVDPPAAGAPAAEDPSAETAAAAARAEAADPSTTPDQAEPAQQDDGPTAPPTLRVVPSSAPHAPADTAVPADAQPDPAPVTHPPAREASRPAARRTAGGRASVPVWADVLLGTAPVRPAPGDPE